MPPAPTARPLPWAAFLVVLTASLACAGGGAPKKAKKPAPASLSDWPAVPERLAAADARLVAESLAAASASADTRAVPTAPTGGPADDIVVIVLDTVRADRLGLYGYDKGTSPNLDAWAKDARVWDRAWTDGPWTLPAHASMFTGLAQRTHAARSLGTDDTRKGAPLGASHLTIAERLAGAGYLTVGIAANRAFLHPSFGLNQGFDVWINEQPKDDPRGTPYLPADRVVPMVQATLTHADPHPRFVFVNLMDAHTPYITREGYVRDQSLLRPKSLPGRGEGFDKVSKRLMLGETIKPEIVASWSEAYDAELRFLDAQLGTLLAGLGDIEHVFILSDHGEYLGEHTLVEHAKDVYEPVLHIPFIARSPKHPPGHVPDLVQTHDLAWMVLEAAGLPVDPAMMRTNGTASSELYYTLKKDLDDPELSPRFNRIRRAHRVMDDKLIVGSDGKQEVYDLATDPGELRPRDGLPSTLDGIDAAFLAAHPEMPVVPADGAALGPDEAALRALGYIE